METPILFIIFKRYDTANQVFNRIREARPKHLYVAADGPRLDVPGEVEDCTLTRSIIEKVDWDCDVHTLFQTENQGCGIGPFKAISWFFEHVDMGIILEDDCLPDNDFFKYCEEMLIRYKDDHRIALITGRNNFDIMPHDNASYFLSAFHFCWGWASWSRVWKEYDYLLSTKTATDYFKHLVRYFGIWNLGVVLWRMNIFFSCKRNQPRDIWDYQFCISTQLHDQFTIVPKKNLVRNIGFDERATHTGGGIDNIEVGKICPLIHTDNLKYFRKIDVVYSRKRCKTLKSVYYFIRNVVNL